MVLIQFLHKGLVVFLTRMLNYFYCKLFRLKMSLNGIKYGNNIKTFNGIPAIVVSIKSSCVVFGNNVLFNNFNDAGWYSKCSIWVREGGRLVVGNNTGFNGVLVYSSNSITIGENVKIGGGTRIFDTDFHSLNAEVRRGLDDEAVSKPIVIEDDVFIGTSCIICKGVTIGHNSIIAAGSVVVKDIPANEVWGGNPARFIRKCN